MNRKLTAAAVMLLALTVSGCGGAQPAAKEQPPAAQQPAPVQQQAPAAQPPAGSAKTMELTVKLGDHFVEPKLLSVPLGTKVKLTITNGGDKKHDFKVEGAYSIASDLLSPGGTQTFEFVADQAGQFKILCTQRGHADKGMEAILEVK